MELDIYLFECPSCEQTFELAEDEFDDHPEECPKCEYEYCCSDCGYFEELVVKTEEDIFNDVIFAE